MPCMLSCDQAKLAISPNATAMHPTAKKHCNINAALIFPRDSWLATFTSFSLIPISASLWDDLHHGWSVERVNHSLVYSDRGKHRNMAESYFPRLRRMVGGQHHHVSPRYLHQYANHVLN